MAEDCLKRLLASEEYLDFQLAQRENIIEKAFAKIDSAMTKEEIAEIEKKLSGTQNNNNSCFYSRGGATKAKIVLDPLGCRGVTDSYDTPERDRNHKIYDGGSAVYVPGFDINMSNLPKELTINGKGWGKGFAGNTVHDFTSKEAKEQEQSAIQSIQEDVPMETFSAMN